MQDPWEMSAQGIPFHHHIHSSASEHLRGAWGTQTKAAPLASGVEHSSVQGKAYTHKSKKGFQVWRGKCIWDAEKTRVAMGGGLAMKRGDTQGDAGAHPTGKSPAEQGESKPGCEPGPARNSILPVLRLKYCLGRNLAI